MSGRQPKHAPPRPYLDFAREVLDHELIDREGVACGMVDDLEIEGAVGRGTSCITALIVGPRAWSSRLPGFVAVIVRKIVGDHSVRVPWAEVARISEKIQLRSRAAELGLGRAERKAARWIRRIPGA